MAMEVKIICLGDSAVGKSKLVERFLLQNYKPLQHSTYALQLYEHNTEVDGKTVKVKIWDTAGQEMFQSMHPSYYHQTDACILVFDATRKTTYKNLTKWFEELRSFRPNVPVLCAANKIDANQDIAKKNFAFTSKNGMPLHYVSASDGSNVVKLFTEAIRHAIEYKQNHQTVEDHILNEL